jgi:hypothetical protein
VTLIVSVLRRRPAPMGGVIKILHASLRGTDGTNMQYFDE